MNVAYVAVATIITAIIIPIKIYFFPNVDTILYHPSSCVVIYLIYASSIILDDIYIS